MASGTEQLTIEFQCLPRGGVWSRRIEGASPLFVIYGEGGGCSLELAGEAASLWIPLHGAVDIRTPCIARSVYAKEVLVTDFGSSVKAVVRDSGQWLALLGSRATWGLLLPDISGRGSRLLPEVHAASRELRRKAIAAARCEAPHELEGAVHVLMEEIGALQEFLRAAFARCPGRSHAKKRQVFLRLQRIRDYIRAYCDRELDNDTLARMTNYSEGYFMRTFRSVYLETPHSFLVDQRLRRAHRLLRSGDFSITEVAQACGFENRSAFSRLFKKHFGTTAQHVKSHRKPAGAAE